MTQDAAPNTLNYSSQQAPSAQAWSFAKDFLENKLMSANPLITEHFADIDQVCQLLQDDFSKQQYLQEIAFLAVRNLLPDFANEISPFSEQQAIEYAKQLPALMQSPDFPNFQVHSAELGYLKTMVATTFLIEQYRYQDILKVESGEIFIDAGACFGDTALWAYQNGAAEVYSFEPSESNLEILKLNIGTNGHDVSKIIPLALGEEATTITFFSGLGVAGAAHEADEQQIKEVYQQADNNKELADKYLQKVQCIKLDDWCVENSVQPTFIKLDVEGAEYGAIKGAAQTIQKYKPKMTVCLYHKVEDMWQLPLLLHSLVPEYKFYCRKNQVKNEFILYAVV